MFAVYSDASVDLDAIKMLIYTKGKGGDSHGAEIIRSKIDESNKIQVQLVNFDSESENSLPSREIAIIGQGALKNISKIDFSQAKT